MSCSRRTSRNANASHSISFRLESAAGDLLRFREHFGKRRHARVVLLAVIVAVGFLLRWFGLHWAQGYRPGSIADEIEAYQVALNYAAGEEAAGYIGHPHFHGGRLPGPLWTIFWSAPLRLGGSPDTVMLVMILVNTASIPLVYLVCQKLFGPQCSLWAALLYALSPQPVYHSVGALNAQVMAFFGSLLYLALWDVVKRPGSANIFWVCVLPATMGQFHMITAFLMPAVVLIIFLSATSINKKWLVTGLVSAAALYTPYVRGEMTHDWSNTRQILSARAPFSFSALKFLLLPIDALSNFVDSWMGVSFSDYVRFGNTAVGSVYLLALFNAISVILAVLFVGSFLREFLAVIRDHWRDPHAAFQSSPQVVFTGLFLCLPCLILMLSGAPCFSRYAIVLYPLLFSLPARFLMKLPLSSRWRQPLIAGIAVMTALNAMLILTLFQYQGQLIEHVDYFTPSFRKLQTVYQALQADAGTGAYIRIDSSDYLATTGGEARRGARMIQQYIEIRENLAHFSGERATEELYELRSSACPGKPRERMVYASNGITLVGGSHSSSH
jgi:hypothetical protein